MIYFPKTNIIGYKNNFNLTLNTNIYYNQSIKQRG